jgi:hypothetical protein
MSILFTIILIVAVYFIFKKVKPDSVAINTKRVICPTCTTKQPVVRIPKNSRQLLWGGTTCPKCKTELDKFGNIIKE